MLIIPRTEFVVFGPVRQLPDNRAETPTDTLSSRFAGGRIAVALTAIVLLLGASASAQTGPAVQQTPSQPAPPAALVYGNRPITEFRATLLTRTPAERVAAAQSLLGSIVSSSTVGAVTSHLVEGVMAVAVGDRTVFVLVPGDVDELAGETLEQKGATAASRLQTAVAEQLELRTPARLAVSAVQAVAGSIVFLLLLWALRRGYRVLSVKMPEGAEQKLQQFSVVEDLQLVQATKAVEILRGFISVVAASVALFLMYSWVTFVLRRFPYTRPWGESLREFLLTKMGAVALAIIYWIPDLFTIIVIVLMTRGASRFIYVLFAAVEQDRLHVPGVYPETASPTRRLVIGLLWIVALVASYPYLPGSQSEAFKGVSVFIGLVISLGSSGIVGQAMSGFTLTYSRAVRLGDFVRIGDIEGTVAHLGSLSTKIKTERREDVTIPNSVVVATPITNYSRFADVEGVFNSITVTIGYDVPWRQIQAMLLLAAERTSNIKRNPAPVVRQSSLGNVSVEYALLVCLEEPTLRSPTLGALRANVLDVFNEFGVQIMVPSYEGDPAAPKVVRREEWFAAPAPEPPARSVEPLVDKTTAETR